MTRTRAVFGDKRRDREYRKRMIRGEFEFDMKIDMLGCEFFLPIKAIYQYLPLWPVFNATTGRDMPTVHCCGNIWQVNLITKARDVCLPEEDAEIDIGCVFWNHWLLPLDARNKLFDLVDLDAKRRDTKARVDFARRSGGHATVIKFPRHPEPTTETRRNALGPA